MIYRLIYLTLLLVTIGACNDRATNDEVKETETETVRTGPTANADGTVSYPSLEASRMEYLWHNATYMDATFYNLPISINQGSIEQIRSTIATISAETFDVPAAAKPLGHIWFQVNGKNVEEADIYYQPDAVGYLWYENGKPAYTNKMTQEGVQFYNNIIQSIPKQ